MGGIRLTRRIKKAADRPVADRGSAENLAQARAEYWGVGVSRRASARRQRAPEPEEREEPSSDEEMAEAAPAGAPAPAEAPGDGGDGEDDDDDASESSDERHNPPPPPGPDGGGDGGGGDGDGGGGGGPPGGGGGGGPPGGGGAPGGGGGGAGAAVPPAVPPLVYGPWENLLQGLGFNQYAIVYLRSQGLTSIKVLYDLDATSMDRFFAHITKHRPPFVILSFPAMRGLMVLKTWLNYRKHLGLSISVRKFTHAVKEKFEKRLREIEELEKAAVEDKDVLPKLEPLKKATDWRVFEEQLLQELAHYRNVITKVPLTYIVRKHAFPEDVEEVPDLERCESVEQELYYYAKFDPLDDKRVWEIIYSHTFKGDLFHFIERYKARSQGRNAYTELKRQCEGEAGKAAMKQAAYASIKNASFNGGSTRFTFDDYIAKHQKAHNELARLGEPVAESKKVKDFLDNLTDPRLQLAKTAILGDVTKMEDFTAAQQYLKSVYENVKTATPSRRQVAMVEGETGRGAGRGRGGRGRGRGWGGRGRGQGDAKKPKEKVHSGHYTSEEWGQLTEEERARVTALRKSKKRNSSSVETEPNQNKEARTASAVATLAQPAPPALIQPAPLVPPVPPEVAAAAQAREDAARAAVVDFIGDVIGPPGAVSDSEATRDVPNAINVPFGRSGAAAAAQAKKKPWGNAKPAGSLKPGSGGWGAPGGSSNPNPPRIN